MTLFLLNKSIIIQGLRHHCTYSICPHTHTALIKTKLERFSSGHTTFKTPEPKPEFCVTISLIEIPSHLSSSISPQLLSKGSEGTSYPCTPTAILPRSAFWHHIAGSQAGVDTANGETELCIGVLYVFHKPHELHFCCSCK